MSYGSLTTSCPYWIGWPRSCDPIYDWIAVAGPEIVRPTGVGRALATYTIPIEGRDEWLAAARRLA